MNGGGYIEPIGAGWSMGPGPGVLGPGGPGQIAGNLGRAAQEGFKSVFGNEQVAGGVRSVVEGMRGPTPTFGAGPGFDPGLVPEYGPRSFPPSMARDWDANAWRPARFNADPYGPGTFADPAAGGSLVRQGLAEIGRGMLSGARSGAIFSGVISLVTNGYKVVAGKQPVSLAAGSVVADTASGAVSGALGAAASGVALFAATAAGLTVGLPLTLLGIAAGLGGALLGGWIFKRTGLYDGIRNGITRLLGGTSAGQSYGRDIPIGSPWPGGSRVGGMVPVNPNLGRLVPLH